MAAIGEPSRTEPLQVPAPERNPRRETTPAPPVTVPAEPQEVPA